MPTFEYDKESSTTSQYSQFFSYEKGTFHYLTIMLSNCQYNGNVFITDNEGLLVNIQNQFQKITNLEFGGTGSVMVRGNTDSMTLYVIAGYYSTTANLTNSEALSLRSAALNAVTDVENLTVSEIRVESTLLQASTY